MEGASNDVVVLQSFTPRLQSPRTETSDDLTDVVSVLNALFANDVSALFVKKAFAVLLKHVRTRDGAREMHRHLGELTILSMLRVKASVPVIQSYGFVLLRKLACACDESHRVLIENGAIELIANGLRRFPDDVILQSAAAGALAPLVQYDDSSVGIVFSLGLLPVLIRPIVQRSDKTADQAVIYTCAILVAICEARGKDVVGTILSGHVADADTETWPVLQSLAQLLQASVNVDASKRLSVAVTTALLCFMSMDRMVTDVLDELRALSTVSHAMVQFAADASVLKYSGIVCQQLARSPVKRVRTYSPQKPTKTTKVRVSTSPKKEPAVKEGVVYDPMPSIGERDKERALAQAEVADRAVRGNLLTSAYGFAKPLKQSLVVASSPPKEIKPRPPARLPPQSTSPLKSPTKVGRVRPLPTSHTATPGKTALLEKSMAQASTASLEVPRLPLEPRRLQTAPASPRPVHSPTTRSPRKEAWRSPAPSPRQMTTTPRKPTPCKEPELATRPIDAATTGIAANSAAKTSDEPELITRDDVAREVLIATAIVSSALDDAMVQAANEALRRSFDPLPSTPSPPDAFASIAKDGIFAQLFQEVPRSPVRRESKDTDDIVLATMTVLAAEAKDDDTARSVMTDEDTVTASDNIAGEDTAASVAMALLAKQLTLAWVYHAAASVVDDATSSALAASVTSCVLDEMTVTVASLSPECTSDANDATSEDIVGATNEETIIARPPSLARIDAKGDMDLEAAFTEAMASESTGDADARPSELESTSLLDDEPTTKVAAALLDDLSRDVSSPRLVESALMSETPSDAAALQAQRATEAPSESFDEAVLISIVAGRLVRAWMHTTTDEIASSRPHEHDLQAPMLVPDSNPVPDFVSPLVSARDIIPSTVPSLLNLTLDMASQLAHAWITDAAVQAMTTQRESAVTSVAIETVAPAPVVTVIDSPCLDNCPPINASIQTVPMTEEEEDSMCSQVATSILAGHLVRAWIADTIAEVAWFTSRPHEHDVAVPSLNNATPSSLLEKAAALASAPETIDASEMASHDNEVAVAFLAGRLVRTWTYETCGGIAERAPACTAASLAPLNVCDESDSVAVWPAELSEDETTQDDMVDVAASVLVAQLVRAWLYETMNGVAQQLSARHFEPSAVAPDCVVASTTLSVAATTLESPLALEVPISDDETTEDDIVDVAASVLAGQLVRAWLYETMHEVVQFSARRHEHAADASACAVTEAPASPVVVDDAPPTLSMAPVIIDGAELETSDDSMVAVSILAAQLVNAWVYETMDNCITQRSAEQLELKTSNSLSELQPSRRTTDEELSPGSDGTSAVEPLADDISDASLVVAVSILAGQLVRMWVYDVMDSIVQRSIQQLASALNVADDAPLVAIDAVSADGKASDEPRDDTVAASIFAGQLVRAWTYDVINAIAQLTARRHEHATSCADAETVVSAIVITDMEAVEMMSFNVEIPDEEAAESEPSASEMDEIHRTVAASMLSGQLVRGWLHEALDNSLASRLSDPAPLLAPLAHEVLHLEETLFVSDLVRSWLFEGIARVVCQQRDTNPAAPVTEIASSATPREASGSNGLLTQTTVYDSVARLFAFATWTPMRELETTALQYARACGDCSTARAVAVAMVDVALGHGMRAALDHVTKSPPDAESSGAALLAAMHDLTAVESAARCLESTRETSPESTLASAIDAPPIVESTAKVTAPSVVWTSWDAPMYDSVANLLSFVAWFSLPVASVPQVARAAPAMPALSLPPTARDEPDEWDQDRGIATSRLAGNLVRSWLHAAVYEPQSATASRVVDTAVDDCMPLDTSSHAGICDAANWDAIAVLNPPVTSTDTLTEAATNIAAQNVRVRLTDAALSAATTTMATNAPDTVTSSELAISVAMVNASDAGISERYRDDVASLAATVAQSCIDTACHVIRAKALSSTASNDEPEPEACESEPTACMDAKVELTKMMRPTALVATRAVDAWMHAALMTLSAAIRTDKSSDVPKTTSRIGTDATSTTLCVADVDGLASVARQYARAATSDAVAVLGAGLSSPSVSIDINAIDVAPTATLVSAMGVASATRDVPDLTLFGGGLDSCLRDMATQLVHAWTDVAIRAMLEQRELTTVAIETPDPPCLDECQPIDAAPLVEEEEDSMCSQVATSILAGHLVRAWIADTIAEVAWFTSRPHEHDAAVPSLNNATPSSRIEKVADATALASAPETIDASEMATHDNEVAVAFLAGRLVRTWVYETCGVIAERALACTAASLAPLDVCDEIDSVVVLPAELSKDETPHDDIVDVAASVLAGQLVRAWLYETMHEVVQFSARRHEHAADASACAVTEAPASPVVVDDAPPTFSMAPVIIDSAELETSDGSMVTVSILAGQLVNAWVYETMDNCITQRSAEQLELKTSNSLSELQPSRRTTDEELSPGSDGTSAVEPLADDISDASLVVAVSILAGQLVRMWVYELLDSIVQRSTQQLAAALNVADDVPLVAIDAVSADSKASDKPRDDTVAASIFAGQLVRAWTYDVINEIAQSTARRHEHAPSCANAETVISAIVITETETADAETVDTETSDAVDATRELVAATTNTAGLLSTNVQVPPEEAEILEPSASEMDEIHRAVAASMISGQLVRGWLHEASLRCVTQQLVTDTSATLPSLTDHVAALTAPWTQPTHGLYVEVAEHFEAASWRPVPASTTSADHSPVAVEGRDCEATIANDDAWVGDAVMHAVPSTSELQRLPMDVVVPLPASELPDLVETMPKVPLWRVNTELSLPIDDAITASRIAGQLVRVRLQDAVSSVAVTTCKPSRSVLLVEGASVVSANENATRLPARPDTSKQASSSSAVDPTLCALLSRHLLSTWLTEAMERTAANAVCVHKEIPAAYDQAQADAPPASMLSVVPPAPPALVVTVHTALAKIEQAVATTLVHRWLVDAVAKAVDDAALESSDSETATSYVSSSDSRSSLSSYSSESASSYGSSSLSSSKASSVSDLHASSVSSLSPLDEAS